MPPSTRRDKIRIDAELLDRLYQRCDGWVQRIHEILVEEEGIQVKYSTLTRMLRGLGIGKPKETAVRSGAGCAWGRVPARYVAP